MLVYDPNARISAAEALEHPYLKELHNPDEEDCCHQGSRFPTRTRPLYSSPLDSPSTLLGFDFEFEHEQNLTVDDVKKLIAIEIAKMNPPVETPTGDYYHMDNYYHIWTSIIQS